MEITSLINLNPTNKQEAESFVERVTQSVESGELNALELHVKLNAMEKAIAGVKKNVREYVMNEAGKYHDRVFDAYSAKIEKTEVGTKYDYTQCNDPEWMEAFEQEKQWAEKRKEREKFLQSLKTFMAIVSADGEVITIYPPVKSSDSFIKVTLK